MRGLFRLARPRPFMRRIHGPFFAAVIVPIVMIAELPVRADGTPTYEDHTHLLVYRDGKGNEQPIRTAADWANRRPHIVAAMQQVMGPLPTADKKVPLDPQLTEETVVSGYVRRRLTIAVAPGDRLPV